METKNLKLKTNITLVNENCICHWTVPLTPSEGGAPEGNRRGSRPRSRAPGAPADSPQRAGQHGLGAARVSTHLLRPGESERPGQVLLGEVSLAHPLAVLQRRQPQAPGICAGTQQSGLRLREPSRPCPARLRPRLLRAARRDWERPKPLLGETRPSAEDKRCPRGCPLRYCHTSSPTPHTGPTTGTDSNSKCGTFLGTFSLLQAQRRKQTTCPLCRACRRFSYSRTL